MLGRNRPRLPPFAHRLSANPQQHTGRVSPAKSFNNVIHGHTHTIWEKTSHDNTPPKFWEILSRYPLRELILSNFYSYPK